MQHVLPHCLVMFLRNGASAALNVKNVVTYGAFCCDFRKVGMSQAKAEFVVAFANVVT